MTKEERHNLILDYLMQHNSVLVSDLANKLNVSSVTIRKDLTELEKEKKLYRNHGRAILINPYINDRNVNEKEKFFVEEKRLIGVCAAKLITAKDSILIASGTTMHYFARQIHPLEHLTVITASCKCRKSFPKTRTSTSSSWADSCDTAACPSSRNMPSKCSPTSRAASSTWEWTG